MATYSVYSTGTVSVDNGATTLTGVGTLWQVDPDNPVIVEGDIFFKSGISVPIASVSADGTAELLRPWPGTSLVASTYDIIKNSILRVDGEKVSYSIRDYLVRTRNTPPMYYYTGDEPDVGIGDDGDLALKVDTSNNLLIWKKTGIDWDQVTVGGQWVVSGSDISYSSGSVTIRNGLFEIVNDSSLSAGRGVQATTYSGTSAPVPASLQLRKSRGTEASPVALLSGDRFAVINTSGQYSTTSGQFHNAIVFEFLANENFTATTAGAKLDITIATNGGISRATAISLSGDGTVSIPRTTVSTSPTTGALIIGGGLGVGGEANIGGNHNVYGDTSSVISSAAGISPRYLILAFTGSTPTANGGLSLIRGRGTVASPVAVSSGDRLGHVIVGGQYSSTVDQYGNTGSIEFFAEENFSSTNRGTYVAFFTTSTGASSRTERLRIWANGSAVFGSPTGGAKGTGTINAVAVYDDNVLLTCMGIEYLLDGKVSLNKWDVYGGGHHGLAHVFTGMLEEFDPRDHTSYLRYLAKERSLPGMPGEEAWLHGGYCSGELINRLWLAAELHVSAFKGHVDSVRKEIEDLQNRISSLELMLQKQ